jgi:hypothetical protein
MKVDDGHPLKHPAGDAMLEPSQQGKPEHSGWEPRWRGGMSASRDGMVGELKRVVVPVLRELGFMGTFPHFRREGEDRIALLTFQFASAGGSFVVEVGKFPAKGLQMANEFIPAAEVKMRHLLRRLRLGAKGESGDHWFDYEAGDHERVALSVVPLIRGQATRYWSRAS